MAPLTASIDGPRPPGADQITARLSHEGHLDLESKRAVLNRIRLGNQLAGGSPKLLTGHESRSETRPIKHTTYSVPCPLNHTQTLPCDCDAVLALEWRDSRRSDARNDEDIARLMPAVEAHGIRVAKQRPAA